MDITTIIEAAAALVAAVITAVVIPYIKSRTTAQQQAEINAWVKIAVTAAEQLYTTLEGDKKKQYVLKYLSEKGYDVHDDDIENTIEAAVLELHSQLYGASKEGGAA